MLAFIPENMSQKRKVPFATIDQDEAPLTKKSRKYNPTTTTTAATASHRDGSEQRSLDLVLFPRPSRSRRVASLKAQIANASLLIAEHQHRHSRSRSSSPNELTSTTDTDDERTVSVDDGQCWQSPQGPSGKPQKFSERVTGQRARGYGGGGRRFDQPESCTSSLSPPSSLGSEWEEVAHESRDHLLSGPHGSPKMKSPILSITPVTEFESGKQWPMKQTGPRRKKRFYPPSITGYVQRMASLNARACVSAMMEPVRRPYRRRADLVSSKTTKSPPKELGLGQSGLPVRRVSPRRSPIPPAAAEPGVVTRSRQSSAEKESIAEREPGTERETDQSSLLADLPSPSSSQGYFVLCASPNTLKQCGIIQGFSEASATNSEGLLWNGNTVHPQARVYFTAEGTLPHLIVPPVCPVRPNGVHEAKARVMSLHTKKRKRMRAVKGDNGWCVVGNPIKEVLFPHMDGRKVPRRYYAGMKRKNEELWVRDCITVRSGKRKQDRPFIAKIGSIWRENSGAVMMTLFWYYRPEEAIGIQSADYQKDELLASQHYDDNSVACIEDKCYVLGIRQYCRYRAQCKSVAEGVGRLENFSVVRRGPEVVNTLELESLSTKHRPAGLVFLCHRGYNHIAGRLLKSHKH